MKTRMSLGFGILVSLFLTSGFALANTYNFVQTSGIGGSQYGNGSVLASLDINGYLNDLPSVSNINSINYQQVYSFGDLVGISISPPVEVPTVTLTDFTTIPTPQEFYTGHAPTWIITPGYIYFNYGYSTEFNIQGISLNDISTFSTLSEAPGGYACQTSGCTITGKWVGPATPVPEPNSLILLISGLFGVGLIRRYKQSWLIRLWR